MNHHARAYELSLETEIAVADIGITGHTDVLWFRHTQIGIDEVRVIKQAAYLAPVDADTRTLVIVAQRITREAQNALLKILEEPPKTTQFVLVVPSVQNLLPTVQSRLQLQQSEGVAGKTSVVQLFLAASPRYRLEMIAGWAKEHDRYYLQMIIQSILKHMSRQSGLSISANQALMFLSENAERSGSSPKMLLEYSALVLPVVPE